MNCNDLRYIKTEESLKRTLLKMLEKQKLETISIKELCLNAKCSRNAFYQHYQTKDELYNAILSDILTTIEISTQPIERNQSEMDENKIRAFTYRLLTVIDTRREEFASLMNGNEMFLLFLSESLYQAFQKHYQLVTDGRTLPRQGDLITRYFCCGIAGMTEQWLKDPSISLEQAQQSLDLCTRDNLRKMRDILIGKQCKLK